MMEEEFTVSRLSALIKRSLETNFGRIKLTAEVSTLKIHSSGHAYFSLKDEGAVIDAICWRSTLQSTKHKLENGLKITCFGKVSSYQMQSKYQFVVEKFEPAGIGDLLKLLEERKQKLAKEGLFDSNLKKPIPKFPKIIGVITSPTGAVIRDIIHRVKQRFPTRILLWPVLVQGSEAASQVEKALDGMNSLPENSGGPIDPENDENPKNIRPDVLIVARGGGSFEDLMPFNEENVVRAVFRSKIPVISAVGHETDTTLIDYVSDLRAPTPTAAAELATSDKLQLIQDLEKFSFQLKFSAYGILKRSRLRLKAVGSLSVSWFLSDRRQRLDLCSERLEKNLWNFVGQKKIQLAKLQLSPPILKHNLKEIDERLKHSFVNVLKNSQHRLNLAVNNLESCSYLNILRKGFVWAETPNHKPISSAKEAQKFPKFLLNFSDGPLTVYTRQQISLCDIESEK